MDLAIRVRVGGFSRATDIVNEVRALLEREGWDPDKTMHYEARERGRWAAVPCIFHEGQDCGHIRSTAGRRLYHYECVSLYLRGLYE